MAQPMNTGNSDGANQNQFNDLNRQVQNMQEVQIFKDDTGTRRVLLGKGADGFYGVKVSQTGNDVYTASDNELVMSSAFNSFKIAETGTATLTKAASSLYNSLSVPHSLGVPPIAMAYLNSSTFRLQLPYAEYADALLADAGKMIVYVDCSTDASNVNFRVHTPDGSSPESKYGDALSFDIKYYLLVETAA
jgi:hypothetical protein